MANRISRAKVEEMWFAYQDRQSVHEVASKCGVHWKTVDRYRRLERWDERIERIRADAQRAADYDLAEAMADSLRLVRRYKQKLAHALDAKLVNEDDVTASELEKVVKLEAFVLGGAESRHEILDSFTHWTDDELEAFARDGIAPTTESRRTS